MISNRARPLLAVAVLFLGSATGLCGCAHIQGYEGPKQPVAAIAKIDRFEKFTRLSDFGECTATFVKNVDGIDVGSGAGNVIDILPGEHTVQVEIQTGLCSLEFLSESTALTITFKAEAGRGYDIFGDRGCGKVWLWVTEGSSETIVSGQKIPGSC